jgi:hypothetical protein
MSCILAMSATFTSIQLNIVAG